MEAKKPKGFGKFNRLMKKLVKPTINIECPKCGLKKTVPRDKSDPPSAVLMVVQCPECVGGDFSTPAYYDAKGNEIFGE